MGKTFFFDTYALEKRFGKDYNEQVKKWEANDLDKVIDRLVALDQNARSVEDGAKAYQMELQKEAEKQKRALEERYEALTKETLEKEEKELKKSVSMKEKAETEKLDKATAELEAYFSKNREAWAEQLTQNILEEIV